MEAIELNKFIDCDGVEVNIGDWVEAVRVNVGLSGVVIGLSDSEDEKPFMVRSVDGRIFYFNSEWTKRVGRKYKWQSVDQVDILSEADVIALAKYYYNNSEVEDEIYLDNIDNAVEFIRRADEIEEMR